MKIRPYEKKDFRYVQDICMQTSSYKDNDTPISRAHICSLYCDYYLDNQSEFCFIAVDENDVPVGYVLCAADCDDYGEKMNELYLPLVKKVASGEYFKFSALEKITQRYIRAGYTAHIHMDITEEYCGQGLGTQLLKALEDKLVEINVEGLYLVCGIKNENARAFYEKRGFEDIDYISGAVVYGKKLFTED